MVGCGIRDKEWQKAGRGVKFHVRQLVEAADGLAHQTNLLQRLYMRVVGSCYSRFGLGQESSNVLDQETPSQELRFSQGRNFRSENLDPMRHDADFHSNLELVDVKDSGYNDYPVFALKSHQSIPPQSFFLPMLPKLL